MVSSCSFDPYIARYIAPSAPHVPPEAISSAVVPVNCAIASSSVKI